MLKRRRRVFSSPPKQPAKRPRREQQPPGEHRDRYDWITLWTAIVGVAVVCISTGITAYQAILTRKALEASLDQQRAWLRLTLQPHGGFILGKGGAEIAVDLVTTNVGNVPAIFAKGEARLIPISSSGANTATAPPGYLNVCPKPYRGEWGMSVFPGETVTLPFRIPFASARDINRFADSKRAISFLLVACTTYQSGEGRRPHQTATAYLLEDAKRGRYNLVFNADGSVMQKEQVLLDPFPILNKSD